MSRRSLSTLVPKHLSAAPAEREAPVLRVAMLSFHGCPFARLGEKDSGGMNVYVLQVARQLARAGNHVDIFTRCHDPDDPQVVDLEAGVRLVHLRAGPLDSAKEGLYEHVPEFLTNLLAFHGEMGLAYDVVHSHYWLSGPVGEVLSSRWDAPHVVTFHTLAKTKKMARAGEVEPPQRARRRAADDGYGERGSGVHGARRRMRSGVSMGERTGTSRRFPRA